MMKKALVLLWILLSLSSAQAQSIGGNTSIIAGTTFTTCSTLQLFYNDSSGKFNCMAGTSWDDTNRSLTITGATVTTSKPIIIGTQTWANAATVFSLLDFNVTDTASQATSLLANLKVGGAAKFTVTKGGGGYFAGQLSTDSDTWLKSNTSRLLFGASFDAIIGRNAAASLRLGLADAAAPVAQTLGVQGVVAGTSNTAGALWSLKLSASTGNAVGGDLDILGTPAGGAGSTQNSFVSFLRLRASDKSALFGSYMEMAEMTAPAAPSANGARLYCDDNGAGKTRCSILFATGAAQQIAIEP